MMAATAERAPLQILLVEDDPDDRDLLVEAFRRAGAPHALRIAEDGEEALDVVASCASSRAAPLPDLVLLDLNLPRKSGFEVLEELKASEASRRIPVVVMTTSSAECDVERSYELGASCFITKPSDLSELFSVVQLIERFWLGAVTLPGRSQ